MTIESLRKVFFSIVRAHLNTMQFSWQSGSGGFARTTEPGLVLICIDLRPSSTRGAYCVDRQLAVRVNRFASITEAYAGAGPLGEWTFRRNLSYAFDPSDPSIHSQTMTHENIEAIARTECRLLEQKIVPYALRFSDPSTLVENVQNANDQDCVVAGPDRLLIRLIHAASVGDRKGFESDASKLRALSGKPWLKHMQPAIEAVVSGLERDWRSDGGV